MGAVLRFCGFPLVFVAICQLPQTHGHLRNVDCRMLDRKKMVLVLALLSAVAENSWGQSKQPPRDAKTTQQPVATDQRGTDQVPFTVKVLPTQKTEAERENEQRHRDNETQLTDASWWLACFTLALVFTAVVQAGLFVWQLLLIRKSLGDTKKAACAAEESADAARANAQAIMNAERAYIWPGFAFCIPRPEEAEWNISLLNTGKTAGIFTKAYHALLTETEFKSGNTRRQEFDGRENVIPPNQPGTEMPSGITQIVNAESRISCGYIIYTDVFGQTHVQGWKHRLYPNGRSDSLPGCYSDPVDPVE